MKTRLMIKVSAICLMAVLAGGMVGCKKKPSATPGPGPGMEGAVPITPTEPMTMAPRIGAGMLGERNQPPRLAADTVYFAFDSAVVNPSERSKLDDMAGYMRENPRNVITVEGHCDERGTEEYNRALGERRAQACREYLISAGVDAARLQTISYGKEKAADPGHNEEAWSRNRRGEFIITGQ
ncbi:MAG: peptidoglycan-associated lipoprotein Pal [Verrucomicrobia bacterium]|nr:peptidoglycan-associated lipoprotein Pal [Verrucomicrobiota bacterium]